MKSGLLFSALPIALALLAGGAVAKTTPKDALQALDCNFVDGRPNLIGDKLYILRDLATNEIMVFDGAVKSVYKDPIKAQVMVDSTSRLEIDWVIDNLQFDRSKERVTYHAIVLKADMKILEKSIAGGYENRESRSGTCKVMK